MRELAAAVGHRLPLPALSLSPRLRRRLLAAAAGVAVGLSTYMLLVRDLPVFAVDRVSISGLTTSDAPRLRQALTAAAGDMTTLHVDHDRLMRAVEGYPAVARLEVDADFPGTLRIHVVEHDPAAAVVSGRSRVAVAADGTVLRGLPVSAALPRVKLQGSVPGERLREGAAMRAVMLAGAAPAVLRRRLESVTETPGRGLVARLRRGPELIFGRPARLRAKWVAAARVLADSRSRGASYVDLRLPERPVAGGLPVETLEPVAPAGAPRAKPEAPTTPPAGPAQPQVAAPQQAGPPTATQSPPAQTQPAPPAGPVTAGGGATAKPQP